MEKIETGKYHFKNPVWQNVSAEAMNFVSYLLTYDFNKRPTAKDALQHNWITKIRD